MGVTVLATTDTVLATTARGLLRLSPRPRLLPTPTCCTADTGSDTGATEATTATVSATTDTVSATTARGLLRLSPRPRPTPTCCTADTDTDTVSDTDTDTDTVSDTAATTGDRLPTSFRANLDHHQLTDVQKYSKL